MKKTLYVPGALMFFSLLLQGCGTPRVIFNLDIRARDDQHRIELIAAAKRVVEGRLSSIGEKADLIEVQKVKDTLRMTVEVQSSTIADILRDELTQPFSLRLMKEAADGKGDISVERHGSFSETGITEAHLLGIEAGPDTLPGKGRILLVFSEEGRNLMEKVFKENKNHFLGLFVRKHLISKLKVESDKVLDQIVIADIPSVEIAQVFADDVNTGLFVTFIPTHP